MTRRGGPAGGQDCPGRAAAGDGGGLVVPVPFSMGEFAARLEEGTGRAVKLVPVDMEGGGPSGIFLRTDDADWLCYERRTSPFHQAHIVVSLAAHAVLGDARGTAIDRRLMPDMSSRLIRVMLGDDADGATVTPDRAEAFAFAALARSGLGAYPEVLARRALRELGPLYAALAAAVPEAAESGVGAGKVGGRAGEDAGSWLYRLVIGIREAMLAVGPLRDPDVATAAAGAGRLAGLTGDNLPAGVEAAVLAAAVRRGSDGAGAARSAGDGGSPAAGGRDLAGEAEWLVKVAQAFAELPLARR